MNNAASQTTLAASPAKLRDGSWGARAPSGVRVGDTVTITTRGGKSWDAIVTSVVESLDGASIVTTRSLDRPAPSARPARRSRGTWTGCRCGSVEEYERPGDCSSCRFDR